MGGSVAAAAWVSQGLAGIATLVSRKPQQLIPAHPALQRAPLPPGRPGSLASVTYHGLRSAVPEPTHLTPSPRRVELTGPPASLGGARAPRPCLRSDGHTTRQLPWLPGSPPHSAAPPTWLARGPQLCSHNPRPKHGVWHADVRDSTNAYEVLKKSRLESFLKGPETTLLTPCPQYTSISPAPMTELRSHIPYERQEPPSFPRTVEWDSFSDPSLHSSRNVHCAEPLSTGSW